nr:MAG TPA: hypothetical protein [Caudoviricetes sp.]
MNGTAVNTDCFIAFSPVSFVKQSGCIFAVLPLTDNTFAKYAVCKDSSLLSIKSSKYFAYPIVPPHKK